MLPEGRSVEDEMAGIYAIEGPEWEAEAPKSVSWDVPPYLRLRQDFHGDPGYPITSESVIYKSPKVYPPRDKKPGSSKPNTPVKIICLPYSTSADDAVGLEQADTQKQHEGSSAGESASPASEQLSKEVILEQDLADLQMEIIQREAQWAENEDPDLKSQISGIINQLMKEFQEKTAELQIPRFSDQEAQDMAAADGGQDGVTDDAMGGVESGDSEEKILRDCQAHLNNLAADLFDVMARYEAPCIENLQLALEELHNIITKPQDTKLDTLEWFLAQGQRSISTLSAKADERVGLYTKDPSDANFDLLTARFGEIL